MPPVANFLEAVLVSVTAALVAVLSFLPALAGAVIILVVGWFLSGIAARLVTGLLERVGFEHAAERTGMSGFLSRTGMADPRASFLLGELVKWLIRLIFLEAAASAVHLTAVTSVVSSLILFIPNLIVAIVVLMVGLLLGRFAAGAVRGAAAEAGLQSPNLLARVAQSAIVTLAVLIAVNQVGVAATLVNTLFMGLVGALALGLGLAFGLGGREVAAQMWRGWYAGGQRLAPRLEQAAQAAAESPPPEPGGGADERLSQPRRRPNVE